jgi:ubiquinone biosynthesis protein
VLVGALGVSRGRTSVYGHMATVPTVLSKFGWPSPHARVKRATDLFRRFPFGAPSYDMVDVPADGQVVAFDVQRCPVAEYFLTQDLGELCVESWCNLDFPLAERWGARLERTTTIAGGAERCDFRWHARTARTGGDRGEEHG